ncbi:MAG TPA: hypothetical protein VFE25_09055 [Opitutaceae bacterium]|nr:hypothetical protein [Opitutaceae bacterium]
MTTVLAMVVIAAILGLLTTCGILTFRFHAWAYTVSIAVLGIDTLLMMALTFLTGSWGILVISSICRAGIIYSLYLGSQAAKLYRHRLLNGQA